MILPMENTEKIIFPGVGKYGIYDVTWYPNFCPVCGRNLLKYRDHPEDDPRFAEQTLWLEHDLAMDE